MSKLPLKTLGRGLIIVYTGEGKGKTTAALGLGLRAVGRGLKVLMVQFVKGSWMSGEVEGVKKLHPSFEIIPMGKGFIGIMGNDKPFSEHAAAAKEALEFSRRKIMSNEYDVIILDEVNHALHLGLIDLNDVLELIKSKPHRLNLILTGSHAHSSIIEAADLVTEMKSIKHPYTESYEAVEGIDF